MEVRRAQAHHNQQDPDHVNGGLDEPPIVLEQIDEERRAYQEEDVADLWKGFVIVCLKFYCMFVNINLSY